jgi:hypothetical protein
LNISITSDGTWATSFSVPFHLDKNGQPYPEEAKFAAEVFDSHSYAQRNKANAITGSLHDKYQ